MSTAKHTALPLTASTVWAQGNGETSANFVLDANGKTVAWAAKPEDAALIVQAVNEREGLVALLRSIEFSCNGFCPACNGWNASRNGSTLNAHAKNCQLSAAIDAAKGAP